jgi:hypothetical protein
MKIIDEFKLMFEETVKEMFFLGIICTAGVSIGIIVFFCKLLTKEGDI